MNAACSFKASPRPWTSRTERRLGGRRYESGSDCARSSVFAQGCTPYFTCKFCCQAGIVTSYSITREALETQNWIAVFACFTRNTVCCCLKGNCRVVWRFGANHIPALTTYLEIYYRHLRRTRTKYNSENTFPNGFSLILCMPVSEVCNIRVFGRCNNDIHHIIKTTDGFENFNCRPGICTHFPIVFFSALPIACSFFPIDHTNHIKLQ